MQQDEEDEGKRVVLEWLRGSAIGFLPIVGGLDSAEEKSATRLAGGLTGPNGGQARRLNGPASPGPCLRGRLPLDCFVS